MIISSAIIRMQENSAPTAVDPLQCIYTTCSLPTLKKKPSPKMFYRPIFQVFLKCFKNPKKNHDNLLSTFKPRAFFFSHACQFYGRYDVTGSNYRSLYWVCKTCA